MAEYVTIYFVPFDYAVENDELLDIRKESTRQTATEAGINVDTVTHFVTPHPNEGFSRLWMVATGERHDG
jgi:hypothetical protein